MRPLPRLLVLTDDRVAQMEDLGVRAAACAAAGPGVGLVARRPTGTTDALAALAVRLVSLAAPPMASVFVTARADVALAVGAHGVILRREDLAVPDARKVFASAPSAAGHFVLRSVHSADEAVEAAASGVDAMIAGSIWPSNTHAGRPAAGTALLEQVAALGVPTYAIGGVTGERAHIAMARGAWGVAAIGAVWNAADSYRAARALLAPWEKD